MLGLDTFAVRDFGIFSYHNWKARVDGKAVPLWRANYAFQAVEVPAGRHEVTLVYGDKMFWIGTLLAAWAGLVCTAL